VFAPSRKVLGQADQPVRAGKAKERRSFFVTAADPGDRTTYDQRMTDSIADLTAILHSCPIAIYSTDRFGIVQMWSPAAERLSGFSSHEAVGRFDPIVPEDAIEDELGRVGRAFAGEVALSSVISRRKKDGSTIDLSISVGPLYDESGEARGAVFLAVNVTEEISERRKVELLKGEFVSTVSHELRTPLTSIGAALALIAGGAAGAINDRVAHLIGIADNNAKRLIRLVNDILDIEKLQSGQMVSDSSSREPQSSAIASAGERKSAKEQSSSPDRARVWCSTDLAGWPDRAGESQNRTAEPCLQHPPAGDAGTDGR